jgi:hypothetical protein
MTDLLRAGDSHSLYLITCAQKIELTSREITKSRNTYLIEWALAASERDPARIRLNTCQRSRKQLVCSCVLVKKFSDLRASNLTA